jgi:hypothetical protein
MKTVHALALSVVLGMLLSPSAPAQSSPRFAVTHSVIGGGGAVATSSRFQLNGSVGQPLTAVPKSSRFSIQGGFWIQPAPQSAPQPAPIIFAPAKVGDNFVVMIQTELGKTYTVQYTDSLSAANWQDLSSIPGNGGVETVTNIAPGASQRFYRLLEQ